MDNNTIDIFENDLTLFINDFCEINNIQDMKKESQAVWNSCLRHVYKHVFKNKDILKSNTLLKNNSCIQYSTLNSYNYELVHCILDIYIYDMCMKYDKEVSIVGFSTLTGIDQNTIDNWGTKDGLSDKRLLIYEKLRGFREESLSNKLLSGKVNPVGVLGVLNRHYQWNLPGVSREKAAPAALPASQLPKLGGSVEKNADPVQIFDKSITNTVYTVEDD